MCIRDRAGAADHFTRPVGIVDLEYQVPRTVSNLIKLKRAQHVLNGVESSADTTVVGTPAPSSTDSLDDLLDDDTDDFLLDDDDDLSPEARLATGASDRLYPLSDQGKIAREHEWASTRKSAFSNLPIYFGVGMLVVLLAALSGMVTMYVIDMKEQEMAEKQAKNK